jgi:hypothetical protein
VSRLNPFAADFTTLNPQALYHGEEVSTGFGIQGSVGREGVGDNGAPRAVSSYAHGIICCMPIMSSTAQVFQLTEQASAHWKHDHSVNPVNFTGDEQSVWQVLRGD